MKKQIFLNCLNLQFCRTYPFDIEQVSLGGLPCLVCCHHRANRGGSVNFSIFKLGRVGSIILIFKPGRMGYIFHAQVQTGEGGFNFSNFKMKRVG